MGFSMKVATRGASVAFPVDVPGIQSLLPDDVERLSLGWRNRFEPDEMKAMLHAYPERSAWHPESQEFILVSPWRHREETAILAEISGVRHIRPLINAVFAQCRYQGATVVLTAEMHERQRPRFWQSVGMQPVEKIIALSLSPVRLRRDQPDRLAFKRVSPGDESDLDILLALDHAAFPWLWWNTRDEFVFYLGLTDVEVYLAVLENRVVGYVGMTRYRGWGHLDRVAIAPEQQGKGFGREAVDFSIARGQELGFSSLSLSTQEENWQSRAVYKRAGFTHVRDNDYRLYGHWLLEAQTLSGPGNGVHL